jgi:hypothetical protein
MAKSKQGRPTKMTAEVVRKLEDAFKFGATVTEACFLSDISREMFYQHYRLDQVFSDKIERARSWLVITAKHNLATAIIKGDIKSSVWLLEKRGTLPMDSIQEEIPKEPEDEYDEDDIMILDAYIKTRAKLEEREEN